MCGEHCNKVGDEVIVEALYSGATGRPSTRMVSKLTKVRTQIFGNSGPILGPLMVFLNVLGGIALYPLRLYGAGRPRAHGRIPRVTVV